MRTRALSVTSGLLLVALVSGCPRSTTSGPPPAPAVEETAGATAPGGEDTPPAVPARKLEGLPDIGAVPGLDPNGADKSADLDRGDELFKKQNWKDAEAAYRKALGAGLKRDLAWKASNQILLCALRLSEYDRAEEAARETVGRFLGTIDEARAYRILGNLYLTLPHQGTEKGGKFLRGVYDQGIYRFSYRKDRRLAVLALEKSRDLFAAFDGGDRTSSVPEPDRDKVTTERVEELFDLVSAVVSYGPYDSTWSFPWFAWIAFDESEGGVDEELNPYGYGYYRGKGEGDDEGGPGEAGWPTGIPVAMDGTPLFDVVAPDLRYSQDLGPGVKMKLLLSEIEKLDPTDARDFAARARLRRATLAKNRYGTERLTQWGSFWWNGKQPLMEEMKNVELHTLADGETLTLLGRRLAVVKLPQDEDVLALFRSVEKDFPKSKLASEGLYAAGVYHQSRNQFNEAIEDYEEILARHKDGPRAGAAQAQIDAIRAPEAVVEAMGVQLLGTPIKVKVAHRNIATIHFTAQEIDLSRYMDDVWRDIESDSEQKRYYRDPGNISYDLLQRQEGKGFAFQRYLVGSPVAFEATVKDDGTRRYTTEDVAFAPALSGRHGAWVVEVDRKESLDATSRNIVFIQDTALVEKKFKGQNLYMVANAADGRPISGAPVRVLQYWEEWVQPVPGGQGKTVYHHQTTQTASNGDGIAVVPCANGRSGTQALAMVALPDGRLAFSGLRYFSTYYPGTRWAGTRAIVFTDRPVYRPGQKVRAKVWIRNLVNGVYQEAATGTTSWRVTDPKGQQIASGTMQLDAYGGGDLSLDIAPKDDEPPLGVYNISIGNASYSGGNVFRVEEYRKPEYEVTVEAGKELARLGDKVSGKIKATYLFGAPVADARVTYRIYREEFQQRYFAPGPWDWLYGEGYGWCYYEYGFYPWWGLWGCKRFAPWIPFTPSRELAGEGQGRLSADGTMNFTIDSAPALRDHPDADHRYVVVAEVTDASRRTITGEGQVIVTRQEFGAFVDVDRGYYLPDEEVVVYLRTMTATETPVTTSGKVTFARIKEQSIEGSAATDAAEQVQDVTTDAEGNARLTLRTKRSGQFVIRYETKDSRGQPVSGSAVIWVTGADFNGASYRMNDIEILTDKRTYQPGETAHVLIHSDQPDARVLFATRTDGGTLLDYRVLRLAGKSATLDVPIAAGDVPNFFLEGTTIFGGNVHQEAREVFVPPQGSTMDVTVTTDRTQVGPGGECKVTVQTKTLDGKPVRAQVALSVFDRAVLQIQGEMTPEIRKWFWGDRRSHAFDMDTNLRRDLQPTTGRRDPRSYWPGGIPEDWDGGFGNRWLAIATAERRR
ncbi:MAG: MG2 domain-containing protein [Acidobacteriota bacterium]